MGGLKDALFGSSPSVSSTPTLTKEQQALLNQLIGATSGGVFDENGNVKGITGYQGDLTAGASDIQKQLFGMVPGLLGGNDAANDAMSGFLSKYSGGYDTQGFDPTSTLNLFQSSVYDPSMKSFQEEVLPQIAEKFAGRGSFDSGGTLYEMTKAGGDLVSNLAGTKATMLDSAKNNWDNQELSKFLNINSLIPTMSTALNASNLSGLNEAINLGGTQQGLNQAELTELFNKWQTEQPYNNPYLNLMNLALGTKAIEPVASQGSTGLLGALAPALGSYAGTAAGSSALSSLFGASGGIANLGSSLAGLLMS